MAEQQIKDKTAIVGIGWTPFTRNAGTTVGNLAAQASLNAIEDAGLSVQDIDGVVSYFHKNNDTVHPQQLVHILGIKQCKFTLFHDGGGHWNAAAVLSAVMLVYSGICRSVLVYRARKTYSEGRATRMLRGNDAAGADQFTAPFGSHHAAATFGHHATAYMARYGITTLDFAHLAVIQREHAILNKKAMMRKPITLADHQNSRWIIYPCRLLDCCQETDGAVALVVTSAERARSLRHAPVYIMAGIGGKGETTNLWETNGVNAAPLLYEGAGISPREVSLAEIYDPFTFMCMIHIQDFQLVPKGEVGVWVRERHNALGGDLPVNTHGGLLSEGHIHGMNHFIEAVQQLRPEGVIDDLCEGPHTFNRSICRQVKEPQIALVCGESGGSAMLLRRA